MIVVETKSMTVAADLTAPCLQRPQRGFCGCPGLPFLAVRRGSSNPAELSAPEAAGKKGTRKTNHTNRYIGDVLSAGFLDTIGMMNCICDEIASPTEMAPKYRLALARRGIPDLGGLIV
ncbi:hypothetical protein FOMA001_g9746 [Fusarium oxysporum f. sp. matthiolae]|nr:hypothetical protein FOMA001_g9746 [Fusarium oxysporum f. sp. matthiolae]